MRYNQKDNTIIAFIALAACGLFWGWSFFATRVVTQFGTPIEVLAMRWGIAAIIFLILIFCGKIKIDLKKRGSGYVLLTAICQPCIYSLFETTGIKYTSTSESAIILSTIPCLTLLVGVLFFRKKVTPLMIVSILTAFLGVTICTVFSPDFSLEGKWVGYVLLLCATLISGFYGNLSSKAGETHSSLEITAIMAITSGVLFQVINLLIGNGFHSYARIFSNPAGCLSILMLGVFCSAVCYLLLNFGISHLHPAIATNFYASIATGIGVVSGVLFDGNSFGWFIMIGLILAIVGVLMSSMVGKNNR